MYHVAPIVSHNQRPTVDAQYDFVAIIVAITANRVRSWPPVFANAPWCVLCTEYSVGSWVVCLELQCPVNDLTMSERLRC